MTKDEILEIVKKQNDYFNTGSTFDIQFRIQALKKLYKAIKASETEITDALKEDLGKSPPEGFMCETGLVLSEITYMIKNVKKFARDKKVSTPLSNFPAKSFVRPAPYGTVLIMSPWNYPFLLTVEPLVDALAAGNTCVVKPSAYSPATTKVINRLLKETFDPEYVAVVTGGRNENTALLEAKFDYIFFTGSTEAGKEVLKKAAVHLTPVTLELGGKSPCIVEESADLKVAAKRIVWGKFLNSSQTCVAPDYILCQKSVKEKFLNYLKAEITAQFGTNSLKNPDYGKIINEKHFERVLALIDSSKVIHGGKTDAEKLKIEPTVMNNVTWDDAVMGQEIFGPVLPVLEYTDPEEIPALLQNKPKPLAFYLFTENKKLAKKLLSRCRFGGGCQNDTVIHLATNNLGFGGVGESGMGSYHGKIGFDTFSHKKSIVNRYTFMDVFIRYQPYTKLKAKLLRIFLK